MFTVFSEKLKVIKRRQKAYGLSINIFMNLIKLAICWQPECMVQSSRRQGRFKQIIAFFNEFCLIWGLTQLCLRLNLGFVFNDHFIPAVLSLCSTSFICILDDLKYSSTLFILFSCCTKSFPLLSAWYTLPLSSSQQCSDHQTELFYIHTHSGYNPFISTFQPPLPALPAGEKF